MITSLTFLEDENDRVNKKDTRTQGHKEKRVIEREHGWTNECGHGYGHEYGYLYVKPVQLTLCRIGCSRVFWMNELISDESCWTKGWKDGCVCVRVDSIDININVDNCGDNYLVMAVSPIGQLTYLKNKSGRVWLIAWHAISISSDCDVVE